ncbi:MAG: hypothetical protein M1819_005216 [Sarea resinae]|nr:MAG: hypothetical protein M1819_005216 [Sarea resinae]
MFANVICAPPLGRATIVPYKPSTINFKILLETDLSASDKRWEVAVWHDNHAERRWAALPLHDVANNELPLIVCQESPPRLHKRFFTANIRASPESGPINFTVKFRSSPEEQWKWVNESSSLTDGQIIFQNPTISPDLSEFIGGLNSKLDVRAVASEAPNTNLWSITAPVEAAQGRSSGFSEVKLGLPLAFARWFSLVRLWSPWLAPRHGRGKFSPEKEAILCSFLRRDGLHLVLLAISGIDDVLSLFKSDGEGNVALSARNDRTALGISRAAAAVGKTFESAVAAVMYHARKLVRGDEILDDKREAETPALTEGDVKADWLQNWYDGLTYCTWNGLGQNLTENMIYDALDALKKDNIKVTNLIIDDNWQSLDNEGKSQFERGWADFEANKEGFPQGLKHTVFAIRQYHPNIAHVAVWHAILGYWGGIAPKGKIAREYKTVTVRKKDQFTGGSMTVVDEDDVDRLYEDFYQFLSSAGVDSVKTDAQFYLDELDDADDRRRLISTYQDIWTIKSLRWFSVRAISCMSQVPQIMFHSQMPTNKPTVLVRNSDGELYILLSKEDFSSERFTDFFPDVPESHPWHIFCNAHNSLFTQHLNILPDWDMFQTAHPWASFHAAARCVSGGPVYITDEPAKHNLELIRQMTAQTTQGKTVILRPHNIGKTIEAYIGYEEERLLKIGTYVGRQRTGTGILGVFNVSQRRLGELASLEEFPGTEVGEYIVRAHTTEQVSRVVSRNGWASIVALDIDVGQWEILSAHPVQKFKLQKTREAGDEIRIANFGLLGKMTGAAAIVNTDIYVEDNGRLRFWTSLKALGVLGLYISGLESRTLEDDFMVTILGRAVPFHTIAKDDARNILKIDTEQAWHEMGLNGGWSNEVQVEVFIK